LTGIIGALVGFPALRLQGIYLVIATIPCLHCRGNPGALGKRDPRQRGHACQDHSVARGTSVSRDSPAFYFLCLGVLILTIVGTLNLLRSPTGRRFCRDPRQ